MSVYHCSIKIGSRANGQSAISASAYRSGTALTDKEIGKIADYTKKGGVVFSEISLCKNAPQEFQDRETLWNSVHEIEKSKNSQLWREIEVALPQEFNKDEQINAVRKYVTALTDKGMCADWSLHDKGDGNPHAHIMLTMRGIEPNGKWSAKCRKVYDLDENGEKIFQKTDNHGRKQYKSHKENYNDWNSKDNAELWRAEWANICNKYLSEEKRIDHRSFLRQGKAELPTIHEGYVARQIEKSGKIAERCQINREIRKSNEEIQAIQKQLWNVSRAIQENEKAKSELEYKANAVSTDNQSNDDELEELTKYKRCTAPQSVTEPPKDVSQEIISKVFSKPQTASQSVTERTEQSMTNYVDLLPNVSQNAPQNVRGYALTTYEQAVTKNRQICNRIDQLNRVQTMKSIYKKTKPIKEKYDKIPNNFLFRNKKEKFYNENWEQLRSFEESKDFLKKVYPNCTTLPSDDIVTEEISQLESDRKPLMNIIRNHEQAEKETQQRAYFSRKQLQNSVNHLKQKQAERTDEPLDLTHHSRGMSR